MIKTANEEIVTTRFPETLEQAATFVLNLPFRALNLFRISSFGFWILGMESQPTRQHQLRTL
jgi:hypothetical protein